MGESVRKRKSLWDSIEETQQPAPFAEKKDSFSNIHTDHMDNNSDKNKDSRWQSGERMQGSINKNDEMRKMDRNSHSRRILEGETSDGWGGVLNSSHSPENNRIQANRYKRSRSRSRSHSRERGRGRSRSRSRSRYRNRDYRSRSRSPLPERRPEPHGWTDGRSGGIGISSQPCRDFSSTGKCRKGSQCRFLHDDNSIGQQGGIRIEKDRSERWNRQDSGNSHYHGEKDAPFRNSGNSAYSGTCRDFVRGRCQRGSSCWYPHHDASGETTTMGRSHRSSYNNNDQDDREKPSRNSNQPCKYFMMGTCHRDNCSLSHDTPNHDSFEKKPHDDRWPRPESDGSKWGEIGAVSDTKVSTVWDASVQEGSFNNDTIVGNFAQGTWDNFLKTDESNWGGPSDVLGLTGAGNLLVNTEKSDKAANGNESASFSNGISRLAHLDDKKPVRDHNMATVDYGNSVNALGSYSSVGPRLPLQQVPSPLSLNFPQIKSDAENVVKSEQNEQGSTFLPSITHILHPEQLPQLYAALNPPKSIAPMPSFPLSNGPPHIPSMDAQPIPALLQRHYSEMTDIIGTMKTMESDQKDGATILSELSQVKQNVSAENQSQIAIENTLTEERNQSAVPANKEGQDKTGRENVNVEGKGKDTATNEKDEKALKLFKVSLVELVKEILKPKWKEGQMSRDVHKTIVKKVVDKVTASLQGDNIPNTPQKVEQYLSYSKSKISKLAEAYFERLKKSS